jgi:NADPH:quinone reductase-like Zn-dependent oxidoreductase
MKAIVIRTHGGPESLALDELPDPQPKPGHVVIEVKAFGVNAAEVHMRQGDWPEAARVSGIECAGVVKSDPDGVLSPGQAVVALMGGMGRSIWGSYAQFTNVPRSNVVAVETSLPWDALAAVPESYATAWSCLFGNLELKGGQTLLVRGATSALGQAAVNLAVQADARVLATTRKRERFGALEALGVRRCFVEGPGLGERVRELHPEGIDAVLDLVGNRVVLESLTVVRRGGRVCEAGWLGGLEPIASFNPMLQMPTGVHYSLFGSFVYGTREFPLSEVPIQSIVDAVAAGKYKAQPAKVFAFEQIREAHALMESGGANGKIVVMGPGVSRDH